MRVLLLAALCLPAVAFAQTPVAASHQYDNGDVATVYTSISEIICTPTAAGCGCKHEWVIDVPPGYEHSDAFMTHYYVKEHGSPGEPIRRLMVNVERQYYDRNNGKLTFTTDADLNTPSGQDIEYGMGVTIVLTNRDTAAVQREQFNCDGTTDADCKAINYFSGDRVWTTPLTGNPVELMGFAARGIDIRLPNEAYLDLERITMDITQHGWANSGPEQLDFRCGISDSTGRDLPLQCAVDAVALSVQSYNGFYYHQEADRKVNGMGSGGPFVPGPWDTGIFGLSEVTTTLLSGPAPFWYHVGGCIRQSLNPDHWYVSGFSSGTMEEGSATCLNVELP